MIRRKLQVISDKGQGAFDVRVFLFVVCFSFVSLLFVPFALAQDTADDIDALNDQIEHRKSEVDQLNDKMEEYQRQINTLSKESASLRNDIDLIENHIALAELDVQSTKTQIETQQLEVQILDERIEEEERAILDQKDMLRAMLFEMNRNDRIGVIEVLFGSSDFNALFSELEHLEDVNEDLNNTLTATYVSKDRLESNRHQQEERLLSLIDLQHELETQVIQLDDQIGAKDLLLVETQSNEAQYRVLMSELRQEQQYITSQIAALQFEIEKKLAEADNQDDPFAGDDGVVMTHPLPSARVTAIFHDPTYPFRHLFEHSGLDLAAPTGTPIMASAPGIVAWTRTGRSYGNYAMIIHGGGYATLYAHMSSFSVGADQFVTRGQVIGGVGSTGFSTGPHLHFEVRLNGIPVNPQAYIVN